MKYMSDSQAYETVSLRSDGVTVTKRFEEDEFPVPAIAFNFESTRDEAVDVVLSDTVPDDVAVEDLGFHPEYGSEFWTIDDDEITFERNLDPEEEYTTVYGIRATGTDNVEQFLSEPQFESVDPPLDEDEADIVGDDSDAVKDVISGDAESVPGLEEDEELSDEDIETLDLKDPNDEEEAEEADASAAADDESEEAEAADDEAESVDSSDSDGAAVEMTEGSIVASMAAELRNKDVTKEDLELLREAFDLASPGGSVKARVDKLQKDVNDVIAYADSLEEFLDENGTGEELMEEVESVREQVSSFDSEISSVESSIAETEDAVDDVSDDVEAVDDEVADIQATVGDVEDQLSEFDSRIGDVADDVDSLHEAVADVDVESQIDDIHDEIEELKEWREQLSSVIGGGD
jgi:methyl-accepting chemotaxis protein